MRSLVAIPSDRVKDSYGSGAHGRGALPSCFGVAIPSDRVKDSYKKDENKEN